MNDDSAYAGDADGPEVSGGDGVDRRGFLECMAWAGTGLVWAAGGGILSSQAFGQSAGRAGAGSYRLADTPSVNVLTPPVSSPRLNFPPLFGEATLARATPRPA